MEDHASDITQSPVFDSVRLGTSCMTTYRRTVFLHELSVDESDEALVHSSLIEVGRGYQVDHCRGTDERRTPHLFPDTYVLPPFLDCPSSPL